MKYIIIGPGNYGFTLASKLTSLGHEVIGIDNEISRVNNMKDKITHAMCMDCTDTMAMQTLPLKEADVIFIAIGEDYGASIMISAFLKQYQIKKLICRAINSIHQTVLEAIGVKEIIFPEKDSADRMVKKLEMNNIVDSLDISDEYSIIEAIVPEQFVNQTLIEANIRAKYNINILTIKRDVTTKNIFGVTQQKTEVLGVIQPQEKLLQNDIIVLFGKIIDIKRLLDVDN